jgi:hypothetical protein
LHPGCHWRFADQQHRQAAAARGGLLHFLHPSASQAGSYKKLTTRGRYLTN